MNDGLNPNDSRKPVRIMVKHKIALVEPGIERNVESNLEPHVKTQPSGSLPEMKLTNVTNDPPEKHQTETKPETQSERAPYEGPEKRPVSDDQEEPFM
jgi:hypothetical protein